MPAGDAAEVASLVFQPARDLVVSFESGLPTLHRSVSHEAYQCDGITLQVIAACCDTTGALFSELQGAYSAESVAKALAELSAAGVLQQRGDTSPAIVDRWADWGPAAWFFHLISQNTKYDITEEEQAATAEQVSEIPAPPRYKCSCGTSERSIVLPPPAPLGHNTSFTEILLNRRTCRNFDIASALTLNELANLLFWPAGALFENDTEHFGRVIKKASPSPGARHGTEVYPIISRVEGIKPGGYHYCCLHHRINLIAELDAIAFVRQALQEQDYFSEAAVTVLFTYDTRRLMWKYKAPRLYRLAHYEVAHYCQNMLLTGVALGLGVYSTGALADSLIEQTLRIDGVDEITMYAAGAGRESLVGPYHRRNVIVSPHLPPDLLPKLPSAEVD